jgi:hypothetical protein
MISMKVSLSQIGLFKGDGFGLFLIKINNDSIGIVMRKIDLV